MANCLKVVLSIDNSEKKAVHDKYSRKLFGARTFQLSEPVSMLWRSTFLFPFFKDVCRSLATY